MWIPPRGPLMYTSNSPGKEKDILPMWTQDPSCGPPLQTSNMGAPMWTPHVDLGTNQRGRKPTP